MFPSAPREKDFGGKRQMQSRHTSALIQRYQSFDTMPTVVI